MVLVTRSGRKALLSWEGLGGTLVWGLIFFPFLFLFKADVIALHGFVTGKKGNVLHQTRIYY